MAIIRTIRESTGLTGVIIVVILILFLLGGNIVRLSTVFFNQHRTDVGKIAGKKITLKDYQGNIDALQHHFLLQYERPLSETEQSFLREKVWQQLLEKILYQKECDALGLTVSQDELVDMVQGNHIHPELKAVFKNSETGVFDKEKLIHYLQSLSQATKSQKEAWCNFEKNIQAVRCKEKLTQLMKQSVFLNELEAQQAHWTAQTALAIKCLYIPYHTYKEDIYASDIMQRIYLEAHENEYKVPASRSIKYVVFPITPTEEDTHNFQEALQDLVKKFAHTKEDKAFAISNTEGDPSLVYRRFTPDQLLTALAQQKATLREGLVIGPIAEGTVYKIYKVAAINTNKALQYEIAVIEKKLRASDSTKDKIFRQAQHFASKIKDQCHFERQAAKKALQVYDATVHKRDEKIGEHTHIREIVRWLYNDAFLGRVSKVFEIDDKYIVAVMYKKVKEGIPSIICLRKDLALKVKNEQKAERIIKQLKENPLGASLEAIADKYGPDAKVLTVQNVRFNKDTLAGIGKAKKAIGRAFSLKKGEKAIVADEQGVIMVELLERNEADTPKNYATYKHDLVQLEKLMQPYYMQKGLEEIAGVQDERYRFY